MEETNWQRLGRLLKEQRISMGFPNRTEFAKTVGFPNTRVVAAIENAERTNFDGSTLTHMEVAYGWAIGSIATVLDGGDPTLYTPSAPAPSPGTERVRTMLDRLSEDADNAQAEFERLAAELSAAEAKVDATNRRVFHYLAMQENLAAEKKSREAELGRPLSQLEWMAIDSVERPTPYRVAELIATHATMDPHEWTRYEMALVERFEAPYPNDVTKGSRFADLSAARALVARLVEPETSEGGGEDGSTDEEAEAQKSRYGLAAKRGGKEPDDESQ